MNNDPVHRKNQDPSVQAGEMAQKALKAFGLPHQGVPPGVSTLPLPRKVLGKGKPGEAPKHGHGKPSGRSKMSRGITRGFRSKTHIGYDTD